MYENTNSSVDWKGIILKVIIAFLVVAIAFTGIKMFTKGKVDKKQETTNVVESNSSTTFTANIEKLKEVGEKYYKDNTDKLPKDGITSMVTLNELINAGVINSLTDADGKVCDGESSYVTAVKTGDKYTIKANLVCGESYSYVTAYLSENDTKVEETTTVTNNGSSTITNSTNVSSTKSTSTKTSTSSCGTSCTPVVSTEVKQNVTINGNKNNSSSSNTSVPKRTYIVSFDRNGGTCNYNSVYVNEGEYVSNPGNCYRSGYNFTGWYLDGREYNFNTPVTRDIKLVANYERNIYSNNINNSDSRIGTSSVVTEVYSMAWDDYNMNRLSVEHTLSVDNALDKIEYEDMIDRDDVIKIKISKIKYSEVIDTATESRTYRNRHSDTFLNSVEARKWESDIDTKDSLGILNNVIFDDYDREYISISNAERNGFYVNWTASRSKSCSNPFSVNLGYAVVDNQCNFGIIYKVTWQYQYEY